jgi:hypothetical protein
MVRTLALIDATVASRRGPSMSRTSISSRAPRGTLLTAFGEISQNPVVPTASMAPARVVLCQKTALHARSDLSCMLVQPPCARSSAQESACVLWMISVGNSDIQCLHCRHEVCI